MTKSGIKANLIAPCGMNCTLCIAYLRQNSSCPGCNINDKNKLPSRSNCKIKNCPELLKYGGKYCFECNFFPCSSLKKLDKRYRTKYGMSMIDNLNKISSLGIRNFIREEKIRWTCSNCSETICVHKKECLNCGSQRKDLFKLKTEIKAY